MKWFNQDSNSPSVTPEAGEKPLGDQSIGSNNGGSLGENNAGGIAEKPGDSPE